MVVRTRLEIEPDFSIDEITHSAYENEQGLVRQFGEQVYVSQREDMLTALKQEDVPDAHRPFQWSMNKDANDRARKWWFANIDGGDEPAPIYPRSNRFPDSWDITGYDSESGYQIRISNNETDDKGRFRYRFVVGTFSKRLGSKYQIVGHRRTGWKRVSDIAKELYDDFEETFRNLYTTFTSRRRNR